MNEIGRVTFSVGLPLSGVVARPLCACTGIVPGGTRMAMASLSRILQRGPGRSLRDAVAAFGDAIRRGEYATSWTPLAAAQLRESFGALAVSACGSHVLQACYGASDARGREQIVQAIARDEQKVAARPSASTVLAPSRRRMRTRR